MITFSFYGFIVKIPFQQENGKMLKAPLWLYMNVLNVNLFSRMSLTTDQVLQKTAGYLGGFRVRKQNKHMKLRR